MAQHLELERALDKIKSTADRVVLFYPHIRAKDLRNMKESSRRCIDHEPFVFVYKETWVDYRNGLKAKVLGEASKNEYVVTLWKCYKTVEDPEHLNLESKSLYLISGIIQEAGTGKTLVESGNSLRVRGGAQKRMKIFAGSVFIVTLHIDEFIPDSGERLTIVNNRSSS